MVNIKSRSSHFLFSSMAIVNLFVQSKPKIGMSFTVCYISGGHSKGKGEHQNEASFYVKQRQLVLSKCMQDCDKSDLYLSVNFRLCRRATFCSHMMPSLPPGDLPLSVHKGTLH